MNLKIKNKIDNLLTNTEFKTKFTNILRRFAEYDIIDEKEAPHIISLLILIYKQKSLIKIKDFEAKIIFKTILYVLLEDTNLLDRINNRKSFDYLVDASLDLALVTTKPCKNKLKLDNNIETICEHRYKLRNNLNVKFEEFEKSQNNNSSCQVNCESENEDISTPHEENLLSE